MRFDHAALLDFVRWLAEMDARAWLKEQRERPEATPRPSGKPKDEGSGHEYET
jgi:hypothetical protein